MNTMHLLNDKLLPARLPRGVVERRSLFNLLERESDKRVIFVSAPAGYGKTVSATLWLFKSNRKIIWIGLDGYDNTPAIFYKLFCTAVLSAQPNNKAIENIYKSPSFDSSPVEHTIRILSEFEPDDNLYALVLDDTHLITNKELLKSAILVQKRLPLSFLTLILTRNVLAEEYKTAVGEGKYALITADELAFSSDEIQICFDWYGHPVSADEITVIHEATSGWPISINALAMRGRLESGQISGQFFIDYVKEQIWSVMSEDLREFMMKTSVVDDLPVELCESITGRTDSRELLEKLRSEYFFVSRISEGVYCYHNLFREFFRDMLAESDADTRELYGKAAKYYLDSKEYFVARWYAMKSGDSTALMHTIYCFSEYRSASVAEFAHYAIMYSNEAPFEDLCEQSPFLNSTLMWENYLCGNAAKMEYYADKTYQFLPLIAERYPQSLETILMIISLDHRFSLRKLISNFASLPRIEHHQENQLGATLTHEMPFIHRSNRDYCELVDESLLNEMKSTFGQLLKEYKEVFIEGIRAGLFLERNMTNEALKSALRAMDLIDGTTSDEIRFSIYIQLVASYYAARDKRYQEIISDTERFIEDSGAHYLNPNFLACKARIQMLNGDMTAASGWLDNYFVTDTEHLELHRIYQYFTTARAYIVLGKTDKAMSFILRLKQLASDFHRPLDIAEAGTLQAVVEWITGLCVEAQRSMETVLADMQPYRFIRTVSIEGAAVLPILKRLEARVKKKDQPSLVQAHYLHEVVLAAYEQSRLYKGITFHITEKPVKLSKQQKRILSLLAKGYKYKEIVEATGLTIHTVKSHASAAYGRLEVNNSIDATLRARELGLID